MNWLEGLGLLGLFIGTFIAATFVPVSSDALFVAILLATKKPIACLLYATVGNWLGSITTYILGRLAKWEWLEKHFRITREKLEKQKSYIDKYGIWMALLSPIPLIGDVITLALGFYRTPWPGTVILLLVGKVVRFGLWMWLFAPAIA